MLGSLARWLRFFGYDCEFGEIVDDAELARRAAEEDRWLLTMDRELAAVGPRTLLVRGASLEDQLADVLHRLELRPQATLALARCGACNGELEDIDRVEARGLAPPHVVANAARLRQCRGCGRVYWPGTHADRIVARLRRVVEGLD
jgi:uncharacterized protein with PIN domain